MKNRIICMSCDKPMVKERKPVLMGSKYKPYVRYVCKPCKRSELHVK